TTKTARCMTTSQNKAEASLTSERELWVSAALFATLNEILDAVVLVREKVGTLALYDAARNARKIVVQRGFDADYLQAVGRDVDRHRAGRFEVDSPTQTRNFC